MKLSIVVAVLESYKIAERQILHMRHILSGLDAEFILVDDGSDPSIYNALSLCESMFNQEKIELEKTVARIICLPFKFTIVETNDAREWSQPAARNTGASFARGEYILFTDIDHILTRECIEESIGFTGDKMHFERRRAILTENLDINRNHADMMEYAYPNELERIDSHFNTFVIKKDLFVDLNGYDEKFCGKYGGDDTDFSDRYSDLVKNRKALPSVKAKNTIYVFPDPRSDRKRLFHGLRR
jgi:predicted glycosyltransferase involved in capsule biosynthesis